jgi:hypothetical protein
MASEFTININVASTTAQSTDKDKLDEVTRKKEADSNTKQKEQTATDDLKAGIKGVVVYNFAKRAANQIVTARLSTVGSRYGDEALQARINNVTSVAKDIGGFGLSVAAGASMGGVVGAVIAVAAEAVTKSISLYQNVVDWTTERMEDNRATQRASERLGVVASGAGRRRY